jgi:hypothetical protein
MKTGCPNSLFKEKSKGSGVFVASVQRVLAIFRSFGGGIVTSLTQKGTVLDEQQAAGAMLGARKV